MKLSILILALLAILAIIPSANISYTDSSSGSHYPLKVILYKPGYVDSDTVVYWYGYASTITSTSQVESYIIKQGLKILTSPGLESYYDNHYPYSLTVISPSTLSSLDEVASVIKTSKVAVLATPYSYYTVNVYTDTGKISVYSWIQVSGDLHVDWRLGYYDYDTNVPPDNSPTRLVILAAHASTVYYSDYWEDFYTYETGTQMNTVDDHTVAFGLYSVDAVVAVDSYPMILSANGQTYKFFPMETPYPMYWPSRTDKLWAINIGSYLAKYINYLASELQKGYSIEKAHEFAIWIDLHNNPDDLLQYCYILSYWKGPGIPVPPYSDHSRIVVIFNTANANTPVVEDPAPPLPPCPPGSPYCNVPQGHVPHESGR